MKKISFAHGLAAISELLDADVSARRNQQRATDAAQEAQYNVEARRKAAAEYLRSHYQHISYSTNAKLPFGLGQRLTIRQLVKVARSWSTDYTEQAAVVEVWSSNVAKQGFLTAYIRAAALAQLQK